MMKFKNELKRGFSMTVALAMCMGTLQVTALADETPDTGVVSDGGNASDAASDTNESSGSEKETYTTSGGKEIAVNSDKTQTDSDGNVTHVEGSYTENGEHKDVSVDITKGDKNSDPVEASSTSESGDRVVTEDSSNVTERDEQGRPILENVVHEEQQVTEITSDSEGTKESQTTTTIEEETGDRILVDVDTENEFEHHDQGETREDALKGTLEVEFAVEAGGGEKTEEDSVNVDKVLKEIEKKVYEAVEETEKTKFKDHGYIKNEDGLWVKTEYDNDGNVTAKFEVKIDVVDVVDENGKTIGYKTVITTTDRKPIDYTIVDDTVGKELDFNNPELPSETSEEKNQLPFETDDIDPSVMQIPANAEPIPGGYQIITTDPETGATTTQTVRFETTGKYQTIVTETFVSTDEIVGKITETEKERVDITTTSNTTELKVVNDKLSVGMSMTENQNNVSEADKYDIFSGCTGTEQKLEEETEQKVLQELKDKYGWSGISEDCMTGAAVHVKQDAADGKYESKVVVDLQISNSQLDESNLILNVTRGNGRVEQHRIVVTEDGKHSVEIKGIGSEETITLNLVGKIEKTYQKDNDYSDEYKIIQNVNLSSEITVSINAADVKVKKNENEKNEKTFDTDIKAYDETRTYETDKKITGKQEEVVTTTTETTVTEQTSTWRTVLERRYTYDTPDDTPGDGPTNNNTDNIVVADPDVPLAEIPETEVPLAEIPDMEVPLADAPVEMDIPDEAVPMADVPAEVVIVDDVVPLADVPKTGDTSDIWYAAAVLSLGGWMLVSGRKREEEDA